MDVHAPSGRSPNPLSAEENGVAKAPSGRELAPKATEGERVTIKLIKTPKSRRLLPPLSRSPSLSEGGFGKLPPIEKHRQRKILGGVRVFLR
jgi:hypothetical protein